MKSRLLLLLAIAIAASSSGCDFSFRCLRDIDCYLPDPPERMVGACLFGGDDSLYCAFPANDCPSGFRWSKATPSSLAEQCVDPSLVPPPDSGADRDAAASFDLSSDS